MIHAEKLNQAGISYEAGLKRFLNDPELYEAVLEAFIGDDLLARARTVYASGDMARLCAVIHEAKGVSGNAGLDTLYAAASDLVTLLRSPSFTEAELICDYQRFVDAYTAANDGIHAALGK